MATQPGIGQDQTAPEIMPEDQSEMLPELEVAIDTIVSSCNTPEEPIRFDQLRESRRLEAFWSGFQRIFWNGENNDWSPIESYLTDEYGDIRLREDTINIYRPHLEAIIAALSVSTPKILPCPKDADNAKDIVAAKAARKALDLIEGTSARQLLIAKTIFTMCNQGVPFWYVYPEADLKNGSVEFPNFETQTEQIETEVCPQCGNDLEMAEMAPDGLVHCEGCDGFVTPQIEQSEQEYEAITSYDKVAKSKICVEVYGLLNVRIPTSCKNLADAPYLIFEREIHVTQAKEKYSWRKDDISSSGDIYSFDRWARTPVEYAGGYSRDLVTERLVWLRPCAYNYLNDDSEMYQLLREQFPEGCLASYINKDLMRIEDSQLDDHWVIGLTPISSRIHFEPIGRQLAPVQEYRTEMDDLVRETIESSIPETFADPSVLDFDQYKKVQSTPGQLFPARPRPGQNLSGAFHELKSATLTQEAPTLIGRLDGDAQFVSGAFSPLYGGENKGGSETLGEYKEQGQRALQRLSLYWKIINQMAEDASELELKHFKRCMLEDEKFAIKNGAGWINIWIRQEELDGEVGRFISESADELPTSWDQKSARYFNTLQMNNPVLTQLLLDANNLGELKKFIGLADLYVPGEDEKNDQLAQIAEMLKSGPQMPVPEMMPPQDPMLAEQGQADPMQMQPEQQMMPDQAQQMQPDLMAPPPQPEPTVPINPLIENQQLRIGVIAAWANGPGGQQAKVENPEGFANVMAQLQQRQMVMQQQQMQAQAAAAAQQTEQPQPEPKGTENA